MGFLDGLRDFAAGYATRDPIGVRRTRMLEELQPYTIASLEEQIAASKSEREMTEFFFGQMKKFAADDEAKRKRDLEEAAAMGTPRGAQQVMGRSVRSPLDALSVLDGLKLQLAMGGGLGGLPQAAASMDYGLAAADPTVPRLPPNYTAPALPTGAGSLADLVAPMTDPLGRLAEAFYSGRLGEMLAPPRRGTSVTDFPMYDPAAWPAMEGGPMFPVRRVPGVAPSLEEILRMAAEAQAQQQANPWRSLEDTPPSRR